MTLLDTDVRVSALARRNPTVKLTVLFVTSVALLFVLDPVTPTVVWALGLIGVVLAGRVPLVTLLRAHLPFLAFALGVFSVNALSRPGTVLWQEGVIRITGEGLVVGAALAARTLAIGVLAIGFVLTTDSLTLMTSLHQNARLGARPSFALMAGYRLLQQLPGEWAAIRAAQAVRAPLRADGSVRRSPASFGRAAFALLVLAIRRGERMAQSLESRGLGLQPRTVWRPIRVEPVDVLFGTGVLAVLGSVIAVAAAFGVLAGPGALF
jgi:energy-coupling factor transporter transmembrane protein EcfT